MRTCTFTALAAIVAGDPPRTTAEKDALARTLGLIDAPQDAKDSILSFTEGARRCGRGPKTLQAWARRGLIKKCTLPGHVRASGVLASEIDRLLAASVRGQEVAS